MVDDYEGALARSYAITHGTTEAQARAALSTGGGMTNEEAYKKQKKRLDTAALLERTLSPTGINPLTGLAYEYYTNPETGEKYQLPNRPYGWGSPGTPDWQNQLREAFVSKTPFGKEAGQDQWLQFMKATPEQREIYDYWGKFGIAGPSLGLFPETAPGTNIPWSKEEAPALYENWMGKLKDYSAYAYNAPESQGHPEIFQYWVRGAQLNYSPDVYYGVYPELQRQYQGVLNDFAQKMEMYNSETGKRTGMPLPANPPSFTEFLTPQERYMYGYTDKPPEGYPLIPTGTRPTMTGGGTPEAYAKQEQKKNQAMLNQFAQSYPNIAGGARSSTWQQLLYPPKIRTVAY